MKGTRLIMNKASELKKTSIRYDRRKDPPTSTRIHVATKKHHRTMDFQESPDQRLL